MKLTQPSWQALWQAKGFEDATAIQTLLATPIQNGESFVAISPTGTGKTLAYLLPVLTQLEPTGALQALVLAPSQELAKQIAQVATEWANPIGLKVQLVVGGANFKRQQEALKLKPEIIVATPGRFVELQNQTRKLKVHQVKHLILDEADYLCDSEHESALYQIRRSLMRDVQTIWVSATYGEPLQQLVAQQLPLYQVATQEVQNNVAHYYVFTSDRQKTAQLKRLAQVVGMQALVFFEQVHELESVAAKLLFQGVKVAVLHGQLSKQEREVALRLVQQGKIQFLLTTDLAARGLDIPELPYIIHFNRIKEVETYIHRSGRTGRMGREGTVISLVNEQEWRDLVTLLAPEKIQLEARVIYAGQLVDPSQMEQLRAEMIAEEKGNQPKAKPQMKKKAATSKSAAKPPQNAKPAKKKKRQRDQKNKGKRKTN